MSKSRDNSAKNQYAKMRFQSHLIALEPRMMFDGAAVATAIDTIGLTAIADGFNAHALLDAGAAGGAKTAADIANPVRVDVAREVTARPIHTQEDLWFRADNDGLVRGFGDVNRLSVAGDAEIAVGSIEPVAADEGTAFIFIDTSVENYEQLVGEWQGLGKIVLIDSTRDGIDQVRAALVGQSNISAIHIISHGDTGMFWLGSTRIDQAAVVGELASSFAAIGAKLSADGDILIYGCDAGADVVGQRLIEAIAATTGADVAA